MKTVGGGEGGGTAPAPARRQTVCRLLPKRCAAWRRLEAMLEDRRRLYNTALEERIGCCRKTGKTRTYVDQGRALTECRRDIPRNGGVSRGRAARHAETARRSVQGVLPAGEERRRAGLPEVPGQALLQQRFHRIRREGARRNAAHSLVRRTEDTAQGREPVSWSEIKFGSGSLQDFFRIRVQFSHSFSTVPSTGAAARACRSGPSTGAWTTAGGSLPGLRTCAGARPAPAFRWQGSVVRRATECSTAWFHNDRRMLNRLLSASLLS